MEDVDVFDRLWWWSVLLLGNFLEIGETGLEIPAYHPVHVHEHLHDLGHERRRTMHQPCDICCVALRHKGEFGGVVGLEGF